MAVYMGRYVPVKTGCVLPARQCVSVSPQGLADWTHSLLAANLQALLFDLLA
jgi:hypothetical protein